ncbi:MAG: MFS transporter [Pseudomonadota bacterium]
MSGPKNKWLILIGLGCTGGLILLDESIIGVALPTIRSDLGISQTSAHWVINAYMLAFACFAAAGGKLADIVGLKRLFIVGAALFGLASLAAGFAEGAVWLIAARAVQGLAAALIFPISIAIASVVFKDQRGFAMGVVAAIGTAFLTAGPLVGGVLVELLSWRWIFWVNVPITIGIIVMTLTILKDLPDSQKGQGLDVAGLVTLVPGLTLLVLLLMQGADWGWISLLSIGSLVGAVLFLTLFGRIELRREEPLIDVSLFGNSTFTASTLILFSTQFAKINIVVFGAMYLQEDLNMSPLIAGIAMLVAVLATPFSAGPAGKLSDRIGSRIPAIGGLAAGTISVAWVGVAAYWDSYFWLVPAFLVFGASMPVCYLPAMREVLNAAPPEKQGQASGVTMTARLLGGTMSIALSGGLLSATGSYQVAFLATAAVMAAIVIFAWFAIKPQEKASSP